MTDVPTLQQTAVVLTYGGAVFVVNDSTWHAILRDVAEFNGNGVMGIIQKRGQRLANRPLIHLGLMTKEEAQTRLAARKKAMARHSERAA